MFRPVEPKMPAVILLNPKFAHNVGGAVRACACWGIEQLWWTGTRVNVNPDLGRLPREERLKGYKIVEQVCGATFPLSDYARAGLKPTVVGVEIVRGAENIAYFEHPQDAVYVFGPEDGSISPGWRAAVHRFVYLPSAFCLNLAAAINVVLYDRRLKAIQNCVEAPSDFDFKDGRDQDMYYTWARGE